ncbi:MAG: hypothetical protein MJ214_01895 [Bacilli bacterium]|nr:hypothetical protein [Bacilli bacterium]
MGEGNGHILWAQKGATAWSLQDDNPYKDKSALEMIDEGNPTFVDKLIAPKKSVSCFNKNTNAWEEKEIINNKNEYDKIFLLSPEEMGSKKTREGAYTYYQERDEVELQGLRIKRQVKENDYGGECFITNHEGQTYPNDVENYAGFNPNESDGGHAYLREPDRETHRAAYNIWFSGVIFPDNCCYYAYSLAPAFCI